MGTIVFDIFLFCGLLALAWIVFAIWLIFFAIRGILRGLGIIGRKSARDDSSCLCNRIRCGAANPANACFCRRCGSPLVARARARVAA